MNLKRSSGVLLHPTSLPGGRLGDEAYRFAFSVLVENGVYGGATAAPAAAEIVNAALKLGLIQQ